VARYSKHSGVHLVIIRRLSPPVLTLFHQNQGGMIMPRSATDLLDLSQLPAPQRREVRDFYQFLLTRQATAGKQEASYRFSDLCGTMSWKGDEQ
jgi:hypothetical protein